MKNSKNDKRGFMKRETLYKIFSDIPTLTTKRLTLRAMRREDAEDMFEYASRADVTEFLLWTEHQSAAYTAEYLKYVESRYALGDFFDWAVTVRENGKMIGTCGFAKIDTVNNSGEIGYVLNPSYHHLGYGAEAASEVIRFGFEVLGLHRIEARFMEGNAPSRHLMERLGMSFEGFERDSVYAKGSYRTIGKYSIISKDFLTEKE